MHVMEGAHHLGETAEELEARMASWTDEEKNLERLYWRGVNRVYDQRERMIEALNRLSDAVKGQRA